MRTSDDRSLDMNAWNWGVLHHVVDVAGIFPGEVWEPVRSGGGTLEADQVTALAGFLADRVLPHIAPGQRMFPDGTITDVPDDGTFYREPSEMWKNYSLHHEVLVEAIEFLRGAGGPITIS